MANRTRSQTRIIEVLECLNSDISAQDLYVHLREKGQGMGLATVYRSLEALQLEGAIQSRTLPSGESRYSLAQKDRHHLNCLQCGKSVAVHCCPVHDLQESLSQEQHFKIYYHTLEFYGLCDHCQTCR